MRKVPLAVMPPPTTTACPLLGARGDSLLTKRVGQEGLRRVAQGCPEPSGRWGQSEMGLHAPPSTSCPLPVSHPPSPLHGRSVLSLACCLVVQSLLVALD